MNRDEHLSATAVCPLCGEKHSLSKCPRWTWTGSRDDVGAFIGRAIRARGEK